MAPIKRAKELVTFSKEHHDGLLLVWKIRQGIRKQVVPQRIASFVQWFWEHHLDQHFRREEELLPAVLNADHPMIRRMMDEHAQIRQALDDLVTPTGLEKFAQLLDDHIRFEERILFQEIENAASPQQLQHIGEALADESACPQWTDEFWK
ncbi:MAG TPA: hemerythrin domain-containing protein [Flavisolibacter sp.]